MNRCGRSKFSCLLQHARRCWLSGWAQHALERRAEVPILRPAPKTMANSTRRAIAGMIDVAMLIVSVGHYRWPETANHLAARLATELQPLGLRVSAPDKEPRFVMADGSPYLFELLIQDMSQFGQVPEPPEAAKETAEQRRTLLRQQADELTGAMTARRRDIDVMDQLVGLLHRHRGPHSARPRARGPLAATPFPRPILRGDGGAERIGSR